jgi:hypothetical protein
MEATITVASILYVELNDLAQNIDFTGFFMLQQGRKC